MIATINVYCEYFGDTRNREPQRLLGKEFKKVGRNQLQYLLGIESLSENLWDEIN